MEHYFKQDYKLDKRRASQSGDLLKIGKLGLIQDGPEQQADKQRQNAQLNMMAMPLRGKSFMIKPQSVQDMHKLFKSPQNKYHQNNSRKDFEKSNVKKQVGKVHLGLTQMAISPHKDTASIKSESVYDNDDSYSLKEGIMTRRKTEILDKIGDLEKRIKNSLRDLYTMFNMDYNQSESAQTEKNQYMPGTGDSLNSLDERIEHRRNNTSFEQ